MCGPSFPFCKLPLTFMCVPSSEVSSPDLRLDLPRYLPWHATATFEASILKEMTQPAGLQAYWYHSFEPKSPDSFGMLCDLRMVSSSATHRKSAMPSPLLLLGYYIYIHTHIL